MVSTLIESGKGAPRPKAFDAVKVTPKIPLAKGTPLITPLAEFRVIPGGKPLAKKVVGELFATI